MWVMLDELSFYLFLGFTAGFFILLAVMLVVFGKMPRGAKAIIGCWLKKGALEMDADDAGHLKLVRTKLSGDEGQLERKDKKGYSNVKIIPRHGNPMVATRYFLEGTGIPVFPAYSGKAVVANPQMLAAMRVARTPKKERDKLPDEIKEWAKSIKVPVKQLVKLVPKDETEESQFVEKTTHKTLFGVDFRDIREFFRETWDEGQFKIRLRQEYQRGWRDRGGQFGKIAIPIGIIIAGVVIALVVVPWLAQSGILG